MYLISISECVTNITLPKLKEKLNSAIHYALLFKVAHENFIQNEAQW